MDMTMSIASLSTNMHMAQVQQEVGYDMLDNSLENLDVMSQGMIKMMESSVTPELGQNIDLYL